MEQDSSTGSFLSARVNPRRVLVSAAAGGAIIAAWGFFFLNELARWSVIGCASVALVGSLVWAGSTIKAPRFIQEASDFRVFLPYFLKVTGYWLVLGFPVGVICADAFRQMAGRGDPVTSLMMLAAVVWFLFAFGLILDHVAKVPFSLRSDGRSIWARSCSGIRTYQIGRTRLGYVGEPGGEAEKLAYLESAGLWEFIPLSGVDPSQREFLAAMIEWAVARGARREDFSLPLKLHPGVSSARIFRGVLILLALFAAGIPLALVGLWWAQRMIYGGQPLFSHLFYGVPLSLAAGLILAASPLAGGLQKLITRDWHPLRDVVEVPISAEPPHEIEGFFVTGNGVLREVEGAIEMSFGEAAWRIGRDALVEVRRCEKRWGHWGDYAAGRFQGYPTELAWRDDSGVIRRIALTARAGRSFREDRRNDRALASALIEWKSGDPGKFGSIRRRSPIFWSSFAVVFLLFATALPFLHRSFVLPRVETGRWLPPSWIQPKKTPQPFFAVQAISDGPLFAEDAIERDEKGNFESSPVNLVWRGESSSGPWHAISAAMLPPILASPGAGRFALVLPEISIMRLGDKRPGLLERRAGAHIRSLADNSARPISALPIGPERLVDTALWGNKRIFFAPAFRSDAGQGSEVITQFTWIDVATDSLHEIESAEIGDRYGSPVFFPSGEHVLYAEHVIGLEDRSIRRIEIDSELKTGERPTYGFSGIFFVSGNTLRVATKADKESGTRIWQVDPATARAEVIETLDLWVGLVSADGERWLLSETLEKRKKLLDEDPGPKQLILYDRAANEKRPLFVIEGETRAMLIEGKDEVLLYSPERGYERRSIAP